MNLLELRMSALFVSVFLLTTTIWAQSTAQINGGVRDQSGAVLPGVEVTATQTATGARRQVITDETGSFLIPSLPIGPYMLEATLPGFRTYVQTGIVLQVGSSPSVNITLEVGQVAETVEVQAGAALVETVTNSIGTVIDNQRVLELPLNGRNATELIFLAGVANAGNSGGINSVRNYPTVVVSVAGGIGNGITYQLDGANHNDAINSLNLPLPFPDALQEFKLETSAVPAQYGYHSAAVVNAVTKSGTNELHGTLFEFLRNGAFNARNTFAATRDTLRRNQFGGVLGGPIQTNKLFFFGGYQGTVEKSDPAQSIGYVPTAEMLAGDFRTAASPACNAGRPITLAAARGFVGNQISPTLFDPAALKFVQRLPASTDPCGQVTFNRLSNQDEHMFVGKIDYQRSDRHSIFGRFFLANLVLPSTYDGKNGLTLAVAETRARASSLAIGDTYLIGSVVNAFRFGVNRSTTLHDPDNFGSWKDFGVNASSFEGNTIRITVNGNGFSMGGASSAILDHSFGGPDYSVFDDVSFVKNGHQFGIGGSYIRQMFTSKSGVNAHGNFTFNGSVTNLPMADFLMGTASAWSQGTLLLYYNRQHFASAYAQGTSKLTPRFTVNYGLRWEPYIAIFSKHGWFGHFSQELFDTNVRSTVYVNAPAGRIHPGDPQWPNGRAVSNDRWGVFLPRIGFVWDPSGDGSTTVRAAFGRFMDRMNLQALTGFSMGAPYGNTIQLTNVSLSNPWAGYPNGDPMPIVRHKDMTFPQSAGYLSFPFDLKPTTMNQWNLSIQHQFGENWMAAANYIGNSTIHLMTSNNANPAVYLGLAPCTINGVSQTVCSTTGNTNQRRRLSLQNVNEGRYYAGINTLDDGGTGSYNGLLLSLQKRLGNASMQANYTWSHCISDAWSGLFSQGGSSRMNDRRAERGNCSTSDTRHVFNISGVAQTPTFAGGLGRVLSGWQVSSIMRVRSGGFFSVTTGLDNALTGVGSQRPNLVGDPYPATQNVDQWIVLSAFAQPATGTYGNLGANNLRGPGRFQFDMGLTRTFQVRENHSLQFRGEAFNVLNNVNLNNPVSSLNSGAFGKIQGAGDPRIVQLALKYTF